MQRHHRRPPCAIRRVPLAVGVALSIWTGAFADPVVTSARVETTRAGVRATVRGELDADDWGAATSVNVEIGGQAATIGAPQLRFARKAARWLFTDRTGDVVRMFRCDLRRGRFVAKVRSADVADYADPLSFRITVGADARFAIPIDTTARVTNFRGRLLPVIDPPDGGDGGGDGDPDPTPAPARVVAYFAEWGVYARNYHVKDIDTSGAAARLTHLNYAFANIGTDLRVELGDPYAAIDKFYGAAASVDGEADTWDPGVLRGSFRQIEELKARHPGLRVLISIGGWSWSGRFSDAALTPESRAAFAESCVDRFLRGNFAPGITKAGIFDGIDIDWEWPGAPGATNNFRAEDTQNFTALLAALRTAIGAQGAVDGRTYSLTIAAPVGAANIAKIDVGAVAAQVDGVNLMSYDLRGGWSSVTGHQAALFQPAGDPVPAEHLWIDHAVDLWTAGGLPAAKLTVGVPFYGRGWTGVAPGPAGHGLWQPASGLAPGTYESGVEDWHVLTALPSSYVRHHDPASGASWLYDSAARVLWTWDDPASLAAKASYVRSNGLAGVMVWELSGDDRAGTLMRSLTDALSAPASR